MRQRNTITVRKGDRTRTIPAALLPAFEARGYAKTANVAPAPEPTEAKRTRKKQEVSDVEAEE